jgi:hypothetical protein
MCCASARSQRSIVEECLKLVYSSLLSFFLRYDLTPLMQMDCPTQSIWKAPELTGSHPFQIGINDRAYRERAELA